MGWGQRFRKAQSKQWRGGGRGGGRDGEPGDFVHVCTLGVMHEASQGGDDETGGNIVPGGDALLVISFIFSILFKTFPFH